MPCYIRQKEVIVSKRMQVFDAAGCVAPAAPSCAACLGGPKDTFARMNEPQVCVSTTNRRAAPAAWAALSGLQASPQVTDSANSQA